MSLTKLNAILAQMAQGQSLDQLKLAYAQMSQAYRSGSPLKLDAPHIQLAYILARMPATVAVLEKVVGQISGYPVSHLLDLGCGPGSMLWASSQYFTLEKATCVDQAAGLLTLGDRIVSESGLNSHIKWQRENLLTYQPTEKHDLVSLSYVLNEFEGPQQEALVLKAWKASTNLVLLVEPGTPTGFLNIRRAREQLIGLGANIVAPCTHENVCPMSELDWCHFSVRLPRSKSHQFLKGPLSHEDEKYSYLIATKLPIEDRPVARIVKRPRVATGLVEFDLCEAEGLNRQKISKRDKDTYKLAKKVDWGDGWNFPGTEG